MIRKIREFIGKKGGAGQLIRYLLVGGSAVLVDFAVFELLLLLLGTDHAVTVFSFRLEPEKAANYVAVVAGFVYSFVLNRMWAFKSKDNVVRQLVLMVLLVCFNGWISGEAISVMGRILHIPFVIAKPVMQAAVACWNYIIYDKIIYRS